MKRLAVMVVVLSFVGPLALADDGGDYGNGNDQRRCHHAEGDCRGSFSPGPFDRSPVDIHDNQVCISPDCSSREKNTTTTRKGQG